jgi:hypothetical protein
MWAGCVHHAFYTLAYRYPESAGAIASANSPRPGHTLSRTTEWKEAVDSCAVVATGPVASFILLDMKECCVFAYESATELKEGFFRLVDVKRFETICNLDMLNEISLIKRKGCRALRKL